MPPDSTRIWKIQRVCELEYVLHQLQVRSVLTLLMYMIQNTIFIFSTGPHNPYHGAVSFDNIGLAWVAIFLVQYLCHMNSHL